MSAVHITPYRGQWYPESVPALQSLLDEKYALSDRRTDRFLPPGIGFVVPHAGPQYSGTVAASVYRTLERQQPKRVVVLGFPHHGMLRGVAVPDVSAIATPFGEVAIEREFDRDIRVIPESRLCDHSLEIQLPFLQRSVPGAAITAVYVGQMNADERRDAAATLARAWRPGTVFVASSDFTHYGREFGYQPFPADRHTRERLRDLDFEYIEAAGSLSSDHFLKALADRGGNVCGAGPIALLLDVLKRIDGDGIYPTILDYQTSGELTGDFHHSVSYAALGFHQKSAFELDVADQTALLNSAAETLRRLRAEGGHHSVACQGGSGMLGAKRGAFVSLHRGDELLGCIGNLAGRHSLSEEISHLALSAALEDPRFRPAASTAGPIDVEISILTPFRRIFDPSEFRVGRHGAYLNVAGRSGLLLPQVAEDHDWTGDDFLRALERKSGLWNGASRDPNGQLYVFEAQVFARPNAVD